MCKNLLSICRITFAEHFCGVCVDATLRRHEVPITSFFSR